MAPPDTFPVINTKGPVMLVDAREIVEFEIIYSITGSMTDDEMFEWCKAGSGAASKFDI